jgi:hypothetical protein
MLLCAAISGDRHGNQRLVMSEFRPVQTVADFTLLDEGEIMEGYFDGFHNAPEPNSERSRSYWHGWRNGQVDNGSRLPDAAHQALALDFQRVTRPN